jgi:hypothetical protein
MTIEMSMIPSPENIDSKAIYYYIEQNMTSMLGLSPEVQYFAVKP